MIKKTVFVGLSGGVDSAVSAALLKQQGYEVVGVFIKTWHPDFLVCNEEAERLDAMRVAAHLNIPFLTFDFQDVYKKEVADYMIAEYRSGRTPNPDVMCNREVKFGAFLKKAINMGADCVATGHYARASSGNNFSQDLLLRNVDRSKNYFPTSLLRGKDTSKDQSYFLWTLKQEQLKKIIFPIGNLKKSEVRALAKKFGLPVAEKKDSQGICFLGEIDLKDFLRHYIKPKRGKVLNEKGEAIGYHDGAAFHTLGERHGFTITKKSPGDGAYYVVGKDIEKNTLVVSQYPLRPSMGRGLLIQNVNWISTIPEENKSYTAQIRYHGEFLPCKINIKTKTRAEIVFARHILAASGQSCVIYERDICLGGGVII
jgi:tRNA-specific 2-thiouridylase